jgi:hypothetical protein
VLSAGVWWLIKQYTKTLVEPGATVPHKVVSRPPTQRVFPDKDPRIQITTLDPELTGDGVLFDSNVCTGISDDLSDVTIKLKETLESMFKNIVKWICPEGFTVQHGNVSVNYYYGEVIQATTVAYYLAGRGLAGSFKLTTELGQDGLFSDLDAAVDEHSGLTSIGKRKLDNIGERFMYQWSDACVVSGLLANFLGMSTVMSGLLSVVTVGLVLASKLARGDNKVVDWIKARANYFFEDISSYDLKNSIIGNMIFTACPHELMAIVLSPMTLLTKFFTRFLKLCTMLVSDNIPVEIFGFKINARIATGWANEGLTENLLSSFSKIMIWVGLAAPACTFNFMMPVMIALGFATSKLVPDWTLVVPLVTGLGSIFTGNSLFSAYFLGFSLRIVHGDIKYSCSKGMNWCFSEKESLRMTSDGVLETEDADYVPGKCYWACMAELLGRSAFDLENETLAELEYTMLLEKEDYEVGGSEMLTYHLADKYQKNIRIVVEGNNMKRTVLSYGEEHHPRVYLYRTGLLEENVTHFLKARLLTGFVQQIKNFLVFPDLNKKWLWNYFNQLAMAGLYYLIWGKIGLAHAGLVAISSLAGVFIVFSRFYVENKVFHNTYSNLFSHKLYTESVVPQSNLASVDMTIPRTKSKNVYCLGVAGLDCWWDRTLAMIKDITTRYPDDAIIVFTSQDDQEKVEELQKAFPSTEIRLKIVEIGDSPARIRSLRTLAMYSGYSDTRYRIRDVDWRITPLEHMARDLNGSIAILPLGISTGPYLQGVVDFQGGAMSGFTDMFLRSHEDWGSYGGDELLLSKMPFDQVLNKLSPGEQGAQYLTTKSIKLDWEVKMYVSRTMIPHWSKWSEIPDKVEWNVTSINYHGDTTWAMKLHYACASKQSFCRRLFSGERVTTSLWSWKGSGILNWLFYGYSVALYAITSLLAKSTFRSSAQSYFKAQTSKTTTGIVATGLTSGIKCGMLVFGAFVGTWQGCLELNDAKSEGEDAAAEDLMFKDKFSDWYRSRVMRGMDRLLGFSYFDIPAASLSSVTALIANPIPVFTGWLLFTAMNLDGFRGAAVANYGSCGMPFGPVVGLITATNTLQFNDTNVGMACVAAAYTSKVLTGSTRIWSFSNGPKLIKEFDDGLCNGSELYYCAPEVRNFTWGYGSHVQAFDLPVGMINVRTSTMIALMRYNLFSVYRSDDVLVVGSGIGGVAQGFLYNRTKPRSLTLSTLDEEGFTTANIVKTMAKDHTDVFEFGRIQDEKLGMYDVVVCDTTVGSESDLLFSDDFSHRDEIIVDAAINLVASLQHVKKNGTFIVSCKVDFSKEIFQTYDYLAATFSKIDITMDPIRRHRGLVWFVCKGIKQKLHCSIYPGKLHRETPWDIMENFGALADDWCEWRESDCFGRVWLEILHRTIKPVYGIEDLVLFSEPTNYWTSIPCNPQTARFLSEAPITYNTDITLHTGSLIRHAVRSAKGFAVVGRSASLPVQDREFNTGVDLILQTIMSNAGILPLNRQFLVPAQNNNAVLDGLYKRYDFEPKIISHEYISFALNYLTKEIISLASGYNFAVASLDELRAVANRKSTMGYMSSSQAKTVGECLDNSPAEILNQFNKLISGGAINLSWHGSPKVEKKEIEDGVTPYIPRLFLYHTGEVRLAEQMIFKRVNDFFGAHGGFRYSMKGDIFDKASKTVKAFESKKNPAALAFESTKWDGHFNLDLFCAATYLIMKACDSGKNGTIARDVAHSMCGHDAVGALYLCSGHVVLPLRAFQKSGSWGTSIKNKLGNIIAILTNLHEADKSFNPEDVDINVEGDDGEVIGEYEIVEKMSKIRNSVFHNLGFPQRGPPAPYTKPEFSVFL